MATFGDDRALQPVPDEAAHLGQGISYPLQVDERGRLRLSAGMQCVTDALASIAQTAPGERVMLPDYGANVSAFEPVNNPGVLEVDIARNLRDYEPRVKNPRVRATLGQNASEQQIAVDCDVAGEATPQTLTYPYFVGPNG